MFVHNLDPVAFEILGLKIYWYSLSYLFGFIFSYFYSKYLIINGFFKIKFIDFEDFISWAVLAVILGGRIGYVFFYNFDFYLNNPIEAIKIWHGGMSFHGGLFGLIFLIFLFSKKRKVKFSEISNLVAACAPLGIFLGRIANFINAELIGKPTNANWGVIFTQNGVLRHPSQLYEAFFEGLIIFFVIFFIIKNKFHKSINVYAVFLILYGFFRFILEFLREPDSHLGYVFLDLSMGQILSIPMFILGIFFLKSNK